MKKALWMDTMSGAIYSYKEACKVFREEYDGDDPTNMIGFFDIFERVE